MPRFSEELNEVYLYTIGSFLEQLECLVTHGAEEYAKAWGASTVEDYFHPLATDDEIERLAESASGDPTVRLFVAEALRSLVRIMAHVAEVQEYPKVHD